MTLEEKLENSLENPEMRELLQNSVDVVLRKIGWKEEEVREARDLLMNKLVSHPAVDSGVTSKEL